MEVKDFLQKWYETFAENVPSEIMERRVLSRGNLPWHIFTWGEVETKEQEEAFELLKTARFNKLIIYGNDIDDNHFVQIVNKMPNLWELTKLYRDVYITDTDFTWTFVLTHEDTLGPYFTTTKD